MLALENTTCVLLVHANLRAVGRVHNVGQPMLACSLDSAHSSLRVGS